MSDRVNITYSLKVDELPVEMRRLWKRVVDELHSAAAHPESINLDDVFSLDSLSQIANIRQQLGSIDYALGDLSNIIQGYMHYQTQPDVSQSPEPAMEELAAKIKEFRSQETTE
tara:strand:+ start:78 stop:419 length:342 start_codon:yes stop_codon:yes gene_type:complete